MEFAPKCTCGNSLSGICNGNDECRLNGTIPIKHRIIVNQPYNNKLFSKRGTIIIPYKMMIELEHDEHASIKLNALFGSFYPLHIDNNFVKQQIIYTGYSNSFRELEENEECGHYVFGFILSDDNKSCDIYFKENDSWKITA